MATLLYAGPLSFLGISWAAAGQFLAEKPSAAIFLQALGLVYLLIGGLLFTSWKGAPILGALAWFPILFLVPVGTIWGIAALRALRQWNGPAAPHPKAPLQLQPRRNKFSLVETVTRSFVAEFGAYEDAQGRPLSVSRDLRIPPGTYARFLDDLRIDHGFSISGADAEEVDSLKALIDVLTNRHFAEGSLY